ncbi:alpha/beta fold hydrolase [Bradyrhizobium erythrophlei]|uniref:alpha/beta fold hydrolase n=1 Tax=Bradyrhizobium erythrophlei TaxID=1437360 RepID=UPI0035E474F9
MSASDATPIILLPGMDGTGELLGSLAERLALVRPVQVCAYPLDRPLGYDQLAAYVVERTPDRPFVILGESFSGPIAIELAAADPRVVGLVLASSFARHPIPAQFAALAPLIDFRWLPKGIIAAALMGSTATPELTARLCRILANLPHKVLQRRFRDVLRVDKRSRLRAITCPVLCLHGRSDRLVRRRQVDEILAEQPRCQIHRFEAAHMLLATHPDEAARAIDDFCAPMDQ